MQTSVKEVHYIMRNKNTDTKNGNPEIKKSGYMVASHSAQRWIGCICNGLQNGPHSL